MKKKPGKTEKKAKITKAIKEREKFQAKAVQMYQNGRKVVNIAVAMGYERGHGQNRVRAALTKAGIYKNSPSK